MQTRPGAHGALGSRPVTDDVGGIGGTGVGDPAVDPVGTVPSPRSAAGATGYVMSPLAKMALARARMRTVVPLDVVRFVAACPSCGADCEWTQEREETRVRSYQDCPCVPELPPFEPHP